jgi:AcrR family transcriptional regulator
MAAGKTSPNPPRQSRSRRTLDRIVASALELIEERGADAVTIVDIVHHANSSVGSFYARFPGKEELLLYLEDRVWEDARQRWEEGIAELDWDQLTLRPMVEEIVRILVESYREDMGRRRAFRQRAKAGDEESPPPGARLHRRILDDLGRLLLTRGQEITHPDPQLAVRLGYRMLIGGIQELLERRRTPGAPDERRAPIDTDLLVTELTRSYLAYLGALDPASGGRAATPVDPGDPFDIWA